MKSESMVSLRSFLFAIVMFGVFQIFFLLQLNYTTLRQQVPNQCDCQCTKQLHIERGGGGVNNKPPNSGQLREVEARIVRQTKPVPIYKTKQEEERNLKRILEAEDKALDREIAANKSKNTVEEDPEEKSPYQPEKLGGKDTRKLYEKLIPGDLVVDPKVNASGFHCTGKTKDILIIYAYSAPGNFEQRSRIRNSYGSVKDYSGIRIQMLFFVGGLSEERNSVRYYNDIVNESSEHGDMVLDSGYIDAYRNLTLKGISALKWISKYCPDNYRVMKVDDDTMVNPYNLVDFLKGQSEITMSEIICKVTQGVGPIRNPKSKYHVSEGEYKDDYYPPYCQGYGYIFPPKVLPDLINAVGKAKLIAMEDVYLTGITGQNAGARLHPLTAMFATTFSKFELFLERITTRPELMIVGHVHEARYVEVFWHLAKQRLNAKLKREAKEEKDRLEGKLVETKKKDFDPYTDE